MQHSPRDHQAQPKIPNLKNVTALEVGIGLGARFGGQGVDEFFRLGDRVEVDGFGGGLRGERKTTDETQAEELGKHGAG